MPIPPSHLREKLHRAHEHIRQVQKEVDSIIGSIPNPVVSKDDPDAVDNLRNTLNSIVIPEPLQIVAGEAVHQTRSALDHFAAQLAGGSSDDKTEFPIYEHRPIKSDEIGHFQRKIKGFSPEAAALIHELQPYELTFDRREDHPLAILRRLNNTDKHRTLLATAVVAKSQYRILIGGGESDTFIPDDDADPVIAELETAVNVESQVAAAIVFPTFGSSKNYPVTQGLAWLRTAAQRVILRFKDIP